MSNTILTRARGLVTRTGGALVLLSAPGFSQFNPPGGEAIYVGDAAPVGSGVQLTAAVGGQTGAVWAKKKQRIACGFETEFTFRMTEGNGDGLAFVIQNDSPNALGLMGGNLGYAGIPRSLAIEFDTYFNSGIDPDDNHVAVQSCGLQPNSAGFDCSILGPFNLWWAGDINDGGSHRVRISYEDCLLKIVVNDIPHGSVSVDLAEVLGLAPNGKAWVGFTAATFAAYQNHYIDDWEFDTANKAYVLVGDIDSCQFGFWPPPSLFCPWSPSPLPALERTAELAIADFEKAGYEVVHIPLASMQAVQFASLDPLARAIWVIGHGRAINSGPPWVFDPEVFMRFGTTLTPTDLLFNDRIVEFSLLSCGQGQFESQWANAFPNATFHGFDRAETAVGLKHWQFKHVYEDLECACEDPGAPTPASSTSATKRGLSQGPPTPGNSLPPPLVDPNLTQHLGTFEYPVGSGSFILELGSVPNGPTLSPTLLAGFGNSRTANVYARHDHPFEHIEEFLVAAEINQGKVTRLSHTPFATPDFNVSYDTKALYGAHQESSLYPSQVVSGDIAFEVLASGLDPAVASAAWGVLFFAQ